MPTPRLKSATELGNYSRDLRPLEWGFGSSRGNDAELLMSALGHKRTCAGAGSVCASWLWKLVELGGISHRRALTSYHLGDESHLGRTV
jgi:hypothetical protein